MAINTNEISSTMNWLSSFGLLESGGVTRLLYTKEWLDAQNSLKEKFESIGMKAEFDAVGNLFGRVEGTEGSEETIATGSHVDTVVNGGKLDGALGIFGGFLAIKYLLETYGKPKKNIEVISMAEEEGSRFPYVFWGSKNLLGLTKKEDVIDIVDENGTKFVDAMHESGFDFKSNNESSLSHVKTFVELHIEQGNALEMEKKSVGIITSIVGQRRYNITLKGEANHAGTTLMEYRRDVMQVFAQIVTESINKAKEAGNPLVLTFGKINVKPNTVNVVPGYAEFTMDCRHTDSQFLKDFTAIIEEDMKRISKESNVEIEIDRWMDEEPVPMNKEVINIIEEACKEQNLNYKLMHSGAGHDSQIIAPRINTGMIFVPSVKGISHNPKEFTELEDLKQGIEALAATIYKLAY
ncbi:allantoate deiminase [Tissierella sp.]|uniref:allantoate deiminase n=1 Tax=Tissierella sp. TaxID=41274 RepID=UPI002865E856|nr:allantoate deiminase [Tissierella sp.]MDR7855280.1 allantoate deiminase [Tissierella sp.]